MWQAPTRMSLSLDMNTSDGTEDDQILQFTLACGGHHGDLPLPKPTHCQPTSSDDHIKLRGDTSFPRKVPTRHACKVIHLPVAGTQSANKDFEIQRGTFNDNSIQACDDKPAYPSSDADACKTGNSLMQKPREYYCYDSTPQTRVKVAESDVLSKQEKLSKKRERTRRVRTAKKALETVLPQSTEVDTKSLEDDIIDYIKFLKLQVKELSQSRLRDESISDPLVFIEGTGHYFVHELGSSKPLEEKIGELIEFDPSAATQLLESKGLSVMPMALLNPPRGLQ